MFFFDNIELTRVYENCFSVLIIKGLIIVQADPFAVVISAFVDFMEQ